ncbi:MAG: S1C family serine protease [Treponema sp.]|nr:S1C family serine protease [Treponema sp.]
MCDKSMCALKTVCLFAGVLVLSVCASCASVKQPKHVYELPDYTSEDVRNEEIKRIAALREKDAVEALWRARLLADADTIASCAEAVVSRYNEAIEKEDWYTALSLYQSLSACGYEKLSALVKDSGTLRELSLQNVPGLSNVSSISASGDTAKKVSAYINGTVTIWVDQGIKVENGVGYADRVIGSGFFIAKDGYIVTNHHVIANLVDPKYEGYARLYIKLAEDSDTRIPAKVIGYDSVIDLALIKAEVDAPYVFTLGSSADLDVGDSIYAIGSPVGLERTLTKGIVSATDRKLFTTGQVMQIDAAINSGNSGGPCIDGNGLVQAIAFAGMLQYEGLNFAIPVEYLKAVLPALYHGGKVRHPWLASYGHTKRELGKNVGLEVQYVMPAGGANRASLAAGDVITALNGVPVTSLEDLQNTLLRYSAGTVCTVTARREDGSERTAAVYLAERPENPGYTVYKNDLIASSFVPILGMKLTSVSSLSSRKFSIQHVIRGSTADESGFSENDYVNVQNVEFNQEKSAAYITIYAKQRKKGYLDVPVGLVATLDSPYYF